MLYNLIEVSDCNTISHRSAYGNIRLINKSRNCPAKGFKALVTLETPGTPNRTNPSFWKFTAC